MSTEQYCIGYEAGYQDAWNAGYRVGVQDGKKTSLEPLDPSSELER